MLNWSFQLKWRLSSQLRYAAKSIQGRKSRIQWNVFHCYTLNLTCLVPLILVQVLPLKSVFYSLLWSINCWHQCDVLFRGLAPWRLSAVPGRQLTPTFQVPWSSFYCYLLQTKRSNLVSLQPRFNQYRPSFAAKLMSSKDFCATYHSAVQYRDAWWRKPFRIHILAKPKHVYIVRRMRP